MRLTTRSEYALLALVHLARDSTGDCLSAEAISAAQAIPQPYLEQILRTIKQAHLVQSTKGKHGGHRLARSARKIAVADVVRLFDGALAGTLSASEYFYEPTPIEKEPKALALFKAVRDQTARKLERATLASLL